MSGITRMALGSALIWAGESAAVLELISESDVLGVEIPFRNSFKLLAMLADGRFDEDYDARTPVPDGSLYSFDDRLLVEASAGDPEKARAMAAEFLQTTEGRDWSAVVAAAVVGDRETANTIASRIDATPGGHFMLLVGAQKCFCGAPFDLESTPDFRARMEESGFNWPPASPISFPLKTW
jgi:hypothetical protein